MRYILLLLLLGLLSSCRTKVQTVEVERLKLVYQDRLSLQRDSVYLHDSIFVHQKGDTIYRDRWRTRSRVVTRHDTTFVEHRDSVSYPVIVEVEKPRGWLQRIELSLYRGIIALLSLYTLFHLIKTYLWRRRR